MKQGKRSVVEENSTQQFKRGRNSMSSPYEYETSAFCPPPMHMAPHYTFTNSEQNDHISFRIMRGTPLKKAMVAYCEQQNKEFTSIRFTLDGHRCRPDLTPDEPRMEDGDEIDAWLEAEGGSYI